MREELKSRPYDAAEDTMCRCMAGDLYQMLNNSNGRPVARFFTSGNEQFRMRLSIIDPAPKEIPFQVYLEYCQKLMSEDYIREGYQAAVIMAKELHKRKVEIPTDD